MAVTAHDDAVLNGAATFSNVAVVPAQVTNNSDSGPGSLRQAPLDAAAMPGMTHTIRFTLPAGSQIINLLTPLPTVGDPVVALLDATQNVTVVLPSGSAWNDNSSLTVNGPGALTFRGGIVGTGNLVIMPAGGKFNCRPHRSKRLGDRWRGRQFLHSDHRRLGCRRQSIGCGTRQRRCKRDGEFSAHVLVQFGERVGHRRRINRFD